MKRRRPAQSDTETMISLLKVFDSTMLSDQEWSELIEVDVEEEAELIRAFHKFASPEYASMGATSQAMIRDALIAARSEADFYARKILQRLSLPFDPITNPQLFFTALRKAIAEYRPKGLGDPKLRSETWSTRLTSERPYILGTKLVTSTPEMLEPDNVLAVVRYRGEILYRLSDRENWILDWNKRRQKFIDAGHAMPELRAMAQQRAGIAILDQDTVELFLDAPGVHRIDPGFLRKSLLERFDSAQSWWDVEFLFPIAFVDFDKRSFAGFYQDGPRLERYVPDDWKGEFADFANTYPEELYPGAAKFWIVDGRDLLRELIERGRNG